MRKATPIQTNFTTGEISPRLYGHVDLAKYHNGCQTLTNFVVMPHGGANRRPGTIYVQPVKDSSLACRIIPFEFSTTQAYIIEMGNKYLRFYKDQDQIVTTGTITGITQANPCVITCSGGHSHLLSDEITISGVVGMTELNGNTYTITARSNTTITLGAVDSSAYTAYSSGGTTTGPYGILSPFKTAELFEIQYAQSADVIWLTHNNFKTQKLTRTGHTAWTLTDYTPNEDQNAKTITGATQANPCVITATSHGYATGDRIRIKDIVGMTELNDRTFVITYATANTFSLNGVDSTGYTAYSSAGTANKDSDPFTGTEQSITGATQANPCVITLTSHGYSNGDRISIHSVKGMTELNGKTYVIANVTANTFELENIDSQSYTAYTRGGTAVYSSGDYPGCVSFHEQRLVLAQTTNNPDKIYGTVAGNYEEMTQTPVADDMAYSYRIASGKVNKIQWMTTGEDLLIGTAGDAYRARGGIETPITPTNISVKPQVSAKSAYIQPVPLDGHAIYVQRSGLKLRDMGYRFDLNKYRADDLTILSEHITSPGITSLDYQEEPDAIIWAIRSDGVLLGCTYNRDQDVIGWHKHETDGTFESVATIPGSSFDETWVIVNRTINGATKRYIEYFHSGVWDTQDEYIYLDCAYTYSGASTSTITGLDHLEGEEVYVVNSGAVEDTKTVTSGSITLDNAGTTVHVGLLYTSTLETLEPEAGNPAGSAQGMKKKWSNVRVKVYRSFGGKIQDQEIDWFKLGHIMDSPADVYTGTLEQADQGYSAAGTITIEQHLPLPFTVLSIAGNLHVGDF